MLELHNVRMEPLSMRKTIRKPPNVTKEPSYVMLEPHNVRMESSDVKRKSKGITKCEKRTVTCDIGTAQCEDGTIKYEKKVREPSNVTKDLLHKMLELHNMRIEPSNVRKK